MRKLKLVAVSLLVVGVLAAGGYYGWRALRPREIGVCVVTDYAFRQRANWDQVVISRFQEVNRIFAPVKIRWKVLKDSSIDPTAGSNGLDQRRAAIADAVDCAGGAVVAITGQPEGQRGGSVSPFSRAAIVVDFPRKSDSENALNLARSLAYFFGAPQEPAGSGTLMAEPAESSRFSEKSAVLLRGLRNYDLAQGISAMTPEFDARATSAIAKAVTGLPGEPVSIAHRTMAMALANEHKMEPAEAHLVAAVKADPRNALLHAELAAARLQRSEGEEALKEIREAVRLEPENPSMHAAYGGVLARTGDPEGAIDEVRRAIEIKPDAALFYVSLGAICLQEPGYINDAIAAYDSAFKTSPNFRVAQMGVERAHAEKNRANEDAARARALTQKSPSSGAFLALGVTETRAANLDAAGAALQRAIDLDPKNGRAHAALARVRYLRKDYSGAWSAADSARGASFEIPQTLTKALQRRQPR